MINLWIIYGWFMRMFEYVNVAICLRCTPSQNTYKIHTEYIQKHGPQPTSWVPRLVGHMNVTTHGCRMEHGIAWSCRSRQRHHKIPHPVWGQRLKHIGQSCSAISANNIQKEIFPGSHNPCIVSKLSVFVGPMWGGEFKMQGRKTFHEQVSLVPRRALTLKDRSSW